MTSQITYSGDLRTEATHLQSGTVIETDAPRDNHGLGERFSPTDLVATGLACCMFSIMGIAARKHGMELNGAKADVEKIMIADPLRRIAEVKVDIYAPPGIHYSDKEQKILEHAALTCPVYLSLGENVIKTVTFHWES